MPHATEQVNEGAKKLAHSFLLYLLSGLPWMVTAQHPLSASDAFPATSSVFPDSQFTCHLLQEVFLGSTSEAVGT